MPKIIIFLLSLIIILFTNNNAFAFGDCKNTINRFDSELADQLKLAKISLSCDSKDQFVCKQNNRSFRCEDMKRKLNDDAKVFMKYHLPEFIELAKLNTPTGYQKKLQSKPISLGKKDTKTFCSFMETNYKETCEYDGDDSGPTTGTANDLWLSFRFILDPKDQAYVYAYKTTDLAFSASCDFSSPSMLCDSGDKSSFNQDLMKKSELLSIINKKK